MRTIEASFSILPHVALDQVEYLIACRLADVGVPIEPLTQTLRYGNLEMTEDIEHPMRRHYTWTGEDRRI